MVTTVIQRANENEMYNIANDAQGNFYISQGDFSTSMIVKVSPTGSITKIAGGVVYIPMGQAIQQNSAI